MASAKNQFILEFSNRVIEHLGIKLYQNKPTNVVAEFVSNAWDADAKKVSIKLVGGTAPQGGGIVITDNGRGMTRSELTDEFLVIGRDRRGGSPTAQTEGKRCPMGRKGIGKLAGFGIAHTVDILSIPNAQCRKDLKEADVKLYWLRFELNAILESPAQNGHSAYKPKVIADAVPISELEELFKAQKVDSIFKEFLDEARLGGGGVCVHLHDTTIKRQVMPEALLSSLAHRFTVTMLHPDFVVTVNGQGVEPATALPKFQEYKIGDITSPQTEVITIAGVERLIKFWVGFVSLKETEWPIESAGIGVYAHHKIAQDRSFFFGVKGKEIFSRYMYGVVEADWLDELPDDVVSTDRRSINWDDDATAELYKWGAAKVSEWLSGFQTWKKNQPRTEIKKFIRDGKVQGLTPTEEDALTELLSDVFLTIGNDDKAKENAVATITSAWTHEPTRKLTQSLWKEVVRPGSDADLIVGLVERLRQSMVPESMSVAVTVAQRIGAITSLKNLIDSNENESHFQSLIEKFPWILGPQWEKLTANQTIRTLITEKFPDEFTGSLTEVQKTAQNKRPDFVFLTNADEMEIVVFELKGSEGEKTLRIDEYRQLNLYLETIYDARPSATIKGILVGHDIGGFAKNYDWITVLRWNDVLNNARKLHLDFLASLINISAPSQNDSRIKQISDFGGKETVELLQKFGAIADLGDAVAFAFPNRVE